MTALLEMLAQNLQMLILSDPHHANIYTDRHRSTDSAAVLCYTEAEMQPPGMGLLHIGTRKDRRHLPTAFSYLNAGTNRPYFSTLNRGFMASSQKAAIAFLTKARFYDKFFI